MIGIITAMQPEMELLKQDIKIDKVDTISGIDYIVGKIKDVQVVLAVCGIGKVFAAICAQTMFLKYKIDFLINTGVSGSLCNELSCGDVCISSSVVQHDMDTSPIGDPIGLISGINVIYFKANQDLVSKISDVANELKIKNITGIIASGDQFIASKEKKDFIVNNFNASAADMETASIGHVAYVNNIPFVSIRAISDSADGSASMDYPTFLKFASKQSATIVKKFIETYNNK